MADAPQIKKLYNRLAILLILGFVVGLGLWLTYEPGSGSINVAGAVIGVWIAAAAYTLVLGSCLYFMGRVATVIAANGGPLSTKRYQTLGVILGIGIAIAAIITLATKPDLLAAEIGAVLMGSAVVLATCTLVLVAFLGFLRGLVNHSDLEDAPSVASLYMALIGLGVVGAVIGAIVLSTATPGAGPVHVAAAAMGVGFASLTLAITTLGLLIYLSSTVKDVVQAAENPAKGNAVTPEPARGATSDPKVSYSPLREATTGRHIIDVEGIGPVYAERLEERMGITTFGQLFAANPSEVAKAAETTTEQVIQWQQMIHLMDIKGIGPQYSEILVMAGVQTPKDLASAEATQLLATIDGIEARRKKQRVIGVNVEEGMVKRFVQLAKTHEDQ